MGNLSNLYISQSFQSLIHLGSDTTITTASVELQDGYGNGLKLYVNNSGSFKATEISASIISASIIVGVGNVGAFTQSVNDKFAALQNVTSSLIAATGSYATTGSNTFVGNQNVTGDITLTGTLTAYAIKSIYETSSVIFSSGSNILGDATNDTQTLIGSIIMSGSSQLTGSMGVSVDINARGAISSSTLTGMGNVTNYSASVYNQFYTQTQVYNPNNDTKWTTLSPVTSSLIDKVYSLELFTASANIQLANLSTSASISNTKWNTIQSVTSSLISQTGSYLVTASVSSSTITFTKQDASTFNIAVTAGFPFTGSAVISGSLNVTGSVNVSGSLNVTGSTINLKSGSSVGNVIDNITDTYTSTAKVNHITTLTSAEYTALSPKDSNTLYIVI
jgi:hypothetical protein